MSWLKEKALVWILKWSGAGWVWKKADGAKTYLAGSAAILSGASQWLQAILGAWGDWSAVLELAKGASSNPGTLAIILGLGLVGLGHKADKAKK